MSAQNIEIVRLLLDAWAGEAPRGALAYMHEDVTFDTSTRPDGKIWRGPRAVGEAMIEWSEIWDEHEVRYGELLEAADGRVALLWSESGRAKHSGVEMSQDGVSVFTLSGGLVSAMVVSVDRDGTLAMLGLASGGE